MIKNLKNLIDSFFVSEDDELKQIVCAMNEEIDLNQDNISNNHSDISKIIKIIEIQHTEEKTDEDVIDNKEDIGELVKILEMQQKEQETKNEVYTNKINNTLITFFHYVKSQKNNTAILNTRIDTLENENRILNKKIDLLYEKMISK